MSLVHVHPLYQERVGEWTRLNDVVRGETFIKARNTTYLPATSGQMADGYGTPSSDGHKRYEAYLARAVFHDIVHDAIEIMLGAMHHKPSVVEVPKVLEPMMENATSDGEDVQTLLRKIHYHQLKSGRLGLLVDVPTGLNVSEAIPYVSIYDALSVRNWVHEVPDGARRRLKLAVLDESDNVFNPNNYEWQYEQRYRVIAFGDDVADEEDFGHTYVTGVSLAENFDPNAVSFIQPTLGGAPMDEIPFVFVNTKDHVPEPDNPPLLGMSSLALALYRGEADYRQTLFQQAQATLVIVGGDPEEETRTGNGAVLHLDVGGSAEYVSVSGAGLSEMRASIDNDKSQAVAMGARLLDVDEGGKNQSGASLQVRVNAKTPTLRTIALTGAAALEQALRYAAAWKGADPDAVKVTANLDFAEEIATGKQLLDLVMAKRAGAPISTDSIHMWMRKRELTDKEFEEELALLDEEEPETPGSGTITPDDDEEEEEEESGDDE